MLDAPPLCAAGDQSNELGLPPLAGTSVEHGLLRDHVVHATVNGCEMPEQSPPGEHGKP